MAWFIIEYERKTWTKYLLQADSEHEALEHGAESGYLGYLDGEDLHAEIVGGPFKSKDKALADKASYVEGR